MRTRLITLGVVMSLAAACSRGSTSTSSATTTASTARGAVVDSTVTSPGNVSSTAPATSPPLRTRQVVFGPVTVQIPASWDQNSSSAGHGTYGAFGPTIHVYKGYAMARLNVASYVGSVDDLAPKFCSGAGKVANGDRLLTSVKLEESGFAPLGDRTAQYRRWTASCPNGPESHRAWYLPISKLAFWESCSDPLITAIVTSAVVKDAPLDPQLAAETPPSAIPQNCNDEDRTDITTGR